MNITEDDFTIWVHHIGGIGGPGPVEKLTRLDNVKYVMYDALEDAVESSQKTMPNTLVVKALVSDKEGEANFYVTKIPSASSLLLPEKNAYDYTVIQGDGKMQRWGTHTELVETLHLPTTTIDKVIHAKSLPKADFLSIDAQGAELMILNGASEMLRDSILGVILEAEFSKLYEGQPLFADTQARLMQDDFRLADMLNTQYMNSGFVSPEVTGKGFIMVSEVFYLKNFPFGSLETDTITVDNLSMDVVRATKLAVISLAFERIEYAYLICKTLEKKGLSFSQLASRYNIKYLKLLRDFIRAADIVNERFPGVDELTHKGKLIPSNDIPYDEISRVIFAYGFGQESINHATWVNSYRKLLRG